MHLMLLEVPAAAVGMLPRYCSFILLVLGDDFDVQNEKNEVNSA